MNRNIMHEVNKWVRSPRFIHFQEAFWEFENENLEAGQVFKQKDIERFQKKAKVPLVGEIHRSAAASNATQRIEPIGKVIQFSPGRQFKVALLHKSSRRREIS